MLDPNEYEIRDLKDDPAYEDYIVSQLNINSDLQQADLEPMEIKSYDDWQKSRWG